jgi:hypothetical protein
LGKLSSHKKQIGLWAALIAIVLTVLFGELPDNSLFWQEVQNSGHTFLFAVIAVLILLLLQNSAVGLRREHLKLYMLAGLTSLLVGVLTELVQLAIGSDSSAMDIMRDLAGIVAGLGLFASVDKTLEPHWLKSRQIIKTGIVVVSICALAAGLFPLAHLSAAYVQRKEAFPVIVDLKAERPVPFIQVKNAIVKAGVDQQVSTVVNLKNLTLVQFSPGLYPGVSIVEPYPDWSSFEMLLLEIYSEQAETFDLVVRVHDEKHNHVYSDRFNKKLVVKAGENHFQIPLHDIEHAPIDREMDMTQISELILFAEQPVDPISFYMGVIRLE